MEFLSSPDVAEMYHIPLRTIQYACAAGVIKARRFGHAWMIDPEAARMYAEKWIPHTRNGKTVEHNGKTID